MLDRGSPCKHEEQMRKCCDYFEMEQPCRATWKSKSRDNHLSVVSSMNGVAAAIVSVFQGFSWPQPQKRQQHMWQFLGGVVTSGNGSMLSVKRPIDDCVGGLASCRTVDVTLSFGCLIVLSLGGAQKGTIICESSQLVATWCGGWFWLNWCFRNKDMFASCCVRVALILFVLFDGFLMYEVLFLCV